MIPLKLTRGVALVLVPFLIVEAAFASFNFADLSSTVAARQFSICACVFTNQALCTLARQFPHPFTLNGKSTASQMELEAAERRSGSVRKSPSRQEQIDRLSIYGVSWWFEPLVVLGAVCTVPWMIAASSQHNV